jgi:hypothetical protein
MNVKIRYNLWKLKKTSAPTGLFKRRLLVQLSSKEHITSFEKTSWFHQAWFRYAAISLVVVIMFGMGGTSVYAYSSPEVTDDHVLYPLKQSIEKVEEHLQTTPEKKTQFYLKQLARREQERKVLQAKNKKIEQVNATIVRVKKQLITVEQKLSTSTPQGQALRKQVHIRLQHHRDLLQKRNTSLQRQETKLEQSLIKFHQKHSSSTR